MAVAHAPRPDTIRDLMAGALAHGPPRATGAKALYARAIRETPAYSDLFADLKNQFARVGRHGGHPPIHQHQAGKRRTAWMVRGVAEALAGPDRPKFFYSASSGNSWRRL